MANKNTLRIRRAMEKTYKRGFAIDSTNGGKWKGGRIDNQEKTVAAIRDLSHRIYGKSA